MESSECPSHDKTNHNRLELLQPNPHSSLTPLLPLFRNNIFGPGRVLRKGGRVESFAGPSRHPWIASAAKIAPAEKRGEGRRGRGLKASIIMKKTPSN